MRQASRRSWRIGQTQPVQVVFMAYRNTLQADALQLVAKKLQSSLAVEGELPRMASPPLAGCDLVLAVADRIVSGGEHADSVESVFAQAQQVEAFQGSDAVGRAATDAILGSSPRTSRGRSAGWSSRASYRESQSLQGV